MTVCTFGGLYTRGAEGLEVEAEREILKERKTREERKEDRGNEKGSSGAERERRGRKQKERQKYKLTRREGIDKKSD